MPKVAPSGAERAIASMPMAPAPPPRFSTTTRCGQRFDNSSASTRASRSAAWPGGNGTMKRTVRSGQPDWARAAPASPASIAPASRPRRLATATMRLSLPNGLPQDADYHHWGKAAMGSTGTARNTVRIAVLPGDGIGTEVTEATLAVLEPLARRHGIGLATEVLPAGAFHYQATGEAFPESSFRARGGGGCDPARRHGLAGASASRTAPRSRRSSTCAFRLHLYAGVRPVRAIPGRAGGAGRPAGAGHRFRARPRKHRGPVPLPRPGAGDATDEAEETLRDHPRHHREASRFAFRLAAAAGGAARPAGRA